ncbi:MAG: tetratricopeptide repeat protein [Labilithrix sp.]|nr:tetratricopeptide repeat protein [Labilithrix sp.]MCW5835933.1 tetratricopeptide repeat protein [Labilithrix sp.]
MNPTIDIVRGELERLFTLEEMTTMSERLLGLAPDEVGGQSAKGSFALALTERCFDGDRIDALVDVILHSRKEVDPRVRDIVTLLGKEELVAGRQLGDFTIQKKIGESDLGVVYQAIRQDGGAKAVYALKVLRREAVRDRRAVHRFLTANRLIGTVDHPGLPRHLEAGEIEPGVFYVAYQYVDAQPLAARLARTGPVAYAELRPILRGILEPLAAIHKAHLVHGDLKTENVLVAPRAGEGSDVGVCLIDFGSDRLRLRSVAANGHTGLLAVYGSPKTVAPEIVRGRAADPKSDVYAFGAVLYELLTGKPVFHHESATDAAFAHLSSEAEPPSHRAPRGWVTKDVDAFVLALLQKDPARRPKDAAAVLDALDSIGRASAQMRAAGGIAPEKVQQMIDTLLAAPSDLEVALTLEHAVDQGADAIRVADAFAAASAQVRGTSDEELETKKTLLFRAARIFDGAGRDKARAEQTYAAIVELDPQDDIALVALEDARKALGKYEELVEMLLNKSQSAAPGEERGRALAEIGRLYATELEDPEQAAVAFGQALCEEPTNEEYAAELERLCGAKHQAWTEQLETIGEALKAGTLAQTDHVALMARAARWYEQKLGRADMALGAYQQVLAADPANEGAAEGMTGIYRRAQQWPELVSVLMARADVAASAPKSRDLRAEAAEILETRLNDMARARDLFMTVLADDPGHARACDAMARIAERTGDFTTLAQILERRAEARRGLEKAEALAKVAEVYEDHLNDLGEATRRFEAVLAVDPTNLNALKGLDRIFNRTGKYRELLEVLERQIQSAATPRQKINLYERVAGLHDEEFLDHQAAAEALEAILAIDPAHDGALSALARHYRALERWEPVCALYEKHAAVTADPTRRIDLLLARARTLAEQIGSPDRATKTYEQILAIQPAHAGALEALAQLREMSGDAHAALTAIEALAMKAATPEAKAEQWMRAARLLETRGDKDSAIERYKLALDANPRDPSASVALRKAYAQRGDWLSVVGLVERELGSAESDLARARLWAELAKVHHSQLVDPQKAEAAAKKSIDLDSSNADGLMVLGDLAFEAGRMIEASKYYESLVNRTGVLAKEDAVRVLVRFMEAFGKTQSRPSLPPTSAASLSQQDLGGPPSSQWIGGGPASQGRISVAPSAPGTVPPPPVTNPRMMAAVEALKQLAPQDVDALARAANALFEFGDPHSAYGMHEELFKKYGNVLAGSDRAEALYHLGESARRSGNLDAAIKPLREAIDLDPSNPRPYRSLAKVYDEKSEWQNAINVRKARLQLATGNERFELLLEIGDVLFAKLSDRTGASKAYTQALEERPDDRKLLTKLMQLYSETQDWSKLVDVVLRLADFVEDPKQRAKYMHTAATIASKHTGEIDKALSFYKRALELEPSNDKALNEAIELYRTKGQNDEVERLLKTQLDQAKVAQDREKIVRVLDKLGELYQKFLNEPDLAVDAYEAAQAFDPDDRSRADKLAEIYASDPAQYLDKAVSSQAAILRKNPYRVESYKLLRKLYTDAKRADPAWCLCQALSILRLAEPDEERFYRKHRSENAAPAQSTLDDEAWGKLMHWDLDPILTRIFAMIQPTIMRTRTQPIEQLGFDPRYAIDTSMHPYPVSQTLYYVQGVLAMPPVLTFQNPNDAGSLGIVHARTPAIVLGQAAFDNTIPNQSLAFLAGRHLTSFRPGFYVRHLVPTGTGLKAWLFAAIKLCVPQFPVSPDLMGQVTEAMQAMGQDFVGAEKDKLASAVSKLLQAGGALDLKKWVASIDLTADRVGFLLAHDLQLTTEVIRSTEEATSVAVKERMKDIVLFSVSEEYFALRQKLSITIDS